MEKQENSVEFWQSIFYPLVLILLAFSSYFIGHEIYQGIKIGFRYLCDAWNYIDIIPPLGIYVYCILIIFIKND